MNALPFTTAAATRLDDRVDHPAVRREYQEYRRALRVASMSVSADLLRTPTVSSWVRRSGVGVHSRSAAELDTALTEGIAPKRITLHCSDDAALTQRAVHAEVGRFVAGSQAQCDALAEVAPHTQRAMIDLSVCTDPYLALHVAASTRLTLIGVHHRLSGAPAEDVVTAMVACITCVRRQYGQIATRLSFADLVPDRCREPRVLRAAAERLESLVEDACARFRYPRPALEVQC